MFLDQSRRFSRKKSFRFKAAAVLTAVLTCLIVPLLYLVSRPGNGYSQKQKTGLTRADLLVAMTATTQRCALAQLWTLPNTFPPLQTSYIHAVLDSMNSPCVVTLYTASAVHTIHTLLTLMLPAECCCLRPPVLGVKGYQL